jgi:hypothetical protein
MHCQVAHKWLLISYIEQLSTYTTRPALHPILIDTLLSKILEAISHCTDPPPFSDICTIQKAFYLQVALGVALTPEQPVGTV